MGEMSDGVGEHPVPACRTGMPRVKLAAVHSEGNRRGAPCRYNQGSPLCKPAPAAARPGLKPRAQGSARACYPSARLHPCCKTLSQRVHSIVAAPAQDVDASPRRLLAQQLPRACDHIPPDVLLVRLDMPLQPAPPVRQRLVQHSRRRLQLDPERFGRQQRRNRRHGTFSSSDRSIYSHP
eukprot:5609452-Prymnesium_polylepis.1